MNETFMLTAFPGVSKPPAQHPIKAELWESDKLYHLTSQLICRAEYEIRRDEARRGELSSPTNSGCTPNIFNQEPDEAFWNPDIVKQEPEEAGIVDQEPEEAGIVSREPDDASWCPTIIKQEPEEAGSYPGVFNQEPIEAPWCPDIKQEPDGASWCSDIAHVEPDKVGRCPDMVRVGTEEAGSCPGVVNVKPDKVGRCPDMVKVGTEEAGSCPGVVNVKPDKVGWCPDMVKVGTEEAGSCPGVVNVEPDKVGWSPYIVKVEPEEVGCCPDLIQVKHDRAGCYWDVVKQDPVSRPSGKECDPLAPGPSRGDAGRTDSLAHPALQPSDLDKMPRKRKRVTFCDDVDILRVVDGNTDLKRVDSGKASVSNEASIVARRHAIRENVGRGKVADLEESLLQWSTHCRGKNVPLTEFTLFKRAKQLALKLKAGTNFTVTVEWLHGFVKRYSIQLKERNGTSEHLHKRLLLTLSDKLNILKVVDDNSHLKRADVARKLQLPVSTLKAIVAKRQELQEKMRRCHFSDVRKWQVQHRRFPELEESLWQWYEAGRVRNNPVSGSILIKKAKQIAVDMNLGPAFTASVAWLHRFLRRHSIKLDTVDVDTAAYWKEERLLPLLQVYTARDIFCVEEAGLFFALLPRGAAGARGRRCRAGELGRERVTMLLATNVDGSEKLPPLVVGSEAPSGNELPASYLHDPSAWITAEAFRAWLRELDAGMVSAGRNVVLFLEGSPVHRADAGRLLNVHLEFLPANGTVQVQPFRQGILHDVKMCYRQHVVRQAIQCLDLRLVEQIKVTVPQAVNYISAAWNKVTPDMIHYCFKRAWFPESTENAGPLKRYSGIREMDWTRLGGENISLKDYLTVDDNLATSSPEQDTTEQDELEESEDDVVLIPNHYEAQAAFQTLQAYLYGHNIDERVQQDVSALCSIIYAMH